MLRVRVAREHPGASPSAMNPGRPSRPGGLDSGAASGDLRQVDLAGFRHRPGLCVESSFGHKLFLRFEFSF